MNKKIIFIFSLLALLLSGCKTNETSSGTSSSEDASQSSDSGNSFDSDNIIDVVLLSGQSNMEGNTNSFGLITDDNGFTNEEVDSINAGYDGIKINYISYYKGNPSFINKSDGFTKTKLGQGNPSGNVRFGPEIGIAETLHNNGYDNKVVLIKCAVGASMLGSGSLSSTKS